MFELTYCSKARQDLSEQDIVDILYVAREFNAENNVTGCLLYHGNKFIQLLEGEKAVVQGLFSRILIDKRHFNVILLNQGSKPERTFRNWSMAFNKLTNDSSKDELGKEMFVNNFVTYSEQAELPTPTIRTFWDGALDLVEEHI